MLRQPPSAVGSCASQGGTWLIFQSISRGLLLFCRARPGLCLPWELAFRWGGFGEAYCVGFFHDLVTLLGKRYLNHLSDLLKSRRASLSLLWCLSECVCVCVCVWEEEQRRIPTMYVLQVGYMYESVPDV